MERPNVINYARMQRIQDATNVPPTGWEMSKSTKVCLAIMCIGGIVLYKRWIDKKQRQRIKIY